LSKQEFQQWCNQLTATITVGPNLPWRMSGVSQMEHQQLRQLHGPIVMLPQEFSYSLKVTNECGTTTVNSSFTIKPHTNSRWYYKPKA
jgi:hypothetical protein